MIANNSELAPPVNRHFNLHVYPNTLIIDEDYDYEYDFDLGGYGVKPVINVMIVEDHPLLIQGLRSVIESEDDLKVIAGVADGNDAVAQAAQLRPDVILMDINLPGKNGLQATREITSIPSLENIGVIILTAYNDDEQLFHALRAGASAYYPKDVDPDVLVPAIRSVATNRCVIRGEIMTKSQAFRWLISQLKRHSTLSESHSEIFAPLRPREMEILVYITRGASNKEIAHNLGISRQTVKNHMSSVLRKLGVEDRTQAAVLALRRGWVRLSDP